MRMKPALCTALFWTCLFGLPAPVPAWGFGGKAVQEPSVLVQARDGIQTYGVNPATAHGFAEVVLAIHEQLPEAPADSPERQLDLRALAEQGTGYLDQALAVATTPVERAILASDKGEMLIIRGDLAGADAVLRPAIQAAPSATTLKPMLRSLKLRGQTRSIPTWCRFARAKLAPKAELERLCELCKGYGADPCTSAVDLDYMADKMRLRLEARDLQAREGSSTDLSYVHDAIISIPVINLCDRVVPVFYGEMPGSSAGVIGYLEPKGSVTKRLQIGSRVWVLDKKGYAVSQIVVRNEAPEITVNPSGNGFRAGTANGY